MQFAIWPSALNNPKVKPIAISQMDETLARSEIHQVLARYCRGVDRCDAALIKSAFHSDAVIIHGALTMDGEAIGAILAAKQLEKYKIGLHHITTSVIEVAGDCAAAETYFQAIFIAVMNDNERVIDSHGRYVDQFERRDGRWRISRRMVVTAWAELRTASGVSKPQGPESLRDRNDVSYTNFEWLELK